MKPVHSCTLAAMCTLLVGSEALGQTEVQGWASIRGIRVQGELMPFVTSIRVVSAEGQQMAITGNERVQRPQFTRQGNKQTHTGTLALGASGSISFTQVIEDLEPGVARLDLDLTPSADMNVGGVYFAIALPKADYANGSAGLMATGDSIALAAPPTTTPKVFEAGAAKGLQFRGTRRQLAMEFGLALEFFQDTRQPNSADYTFYCTIAKGNLQRGQPRHASFTFRATGEVHQEPIKLTIDASKPGRTWDGIGGNFRLQGPDDLPIIQYNLKNLRVAWGRVAMPLNLWHPNEATDPIEAAKAGALNHDVRQAMEMARTLAQRKIPFIISAWKAPDWALGGASPGRRDGGAPQGPGGLRGRPILPEKLAALGRSIAAYLRYMKDEFGAEAETFSFNESDLGIDIRQTAQEHAQMIKTFGPIFAAVGLKTKLLLGDTSDATPLDFIKAAMNDPEAVKYIGAISFHSWRGGTDEQLAFWGQAAGRLNVPVFIGEGGVDPAAHNYPAIFAEAWFCLNEIDLYVRSCALCQLKSVLEWQLTDDYPVLTGGRDSQPLAPTRRFWQLKQLGTTPAGSAWLPIASDQPFVSACALGDAQKGSIAVHLINNGARRAATISGIPASVKELKVFVTDRTRGMRETDQAAVTNGVAQITLDNEAMTSLFSSP